MCFLSFVSDEPNEAGCRSKRTGSLTPVHAVLFVLVFLFPKKTSASRDFGLTLTLSFMGVIRFSGNAITVPRFSLFFLGNCATRFFFRFDVYTVNLWGSAHRWYFMLVNALYGSVTQKENNAV